MKIVIEVNEQRSLDAIIEFSRHCWESTDGNVDYLDVIKQGFVSTTGATADDVSVIQEG